MTYKYIATRSGYLSDNWNGKIKPLGQIKEGTSVFTDVPLEELFGTREDGSPKCSWLQPAETNPRLESDKPVMPKMVQSSQFAAKGGVLPAPTDDGNYQAHMADIARREAIQDGKVSTTPTPVVDTQIPLAKTNDPKLQSQVGKVAAGDNPPAAPVQPAPAQAPAPAAPQAPAAAPVEKPGGDAPTGTGNQDVLGG